MRGPSPLARREVLAGYRAFYRSRWAEGALAPCHDPALKRQARRLRTSGAARPKLDVASIAASCLELKGERQAPPGLVLGKLGKAFEFLELLCVNLLLLPWRKEIRSLKTFTGNFVYYVQSVLPEGMVTKLLEEIGYVPTTSTEFSLVKKLNEEEAEQAAFELFLARIECEDLLEMAEDARESDLMDMLQKRVQKHWCPEENQAGNHQPTQRKECTVARGKNEAEGCLGPQSGYWPAKNLVVDGSGSTGLRSEFVFGCPAEPEPAASKLTPEQNTSQRNQEDASSNSGIKSSDSDDFLIKYSDIIIGQKPLHFTDLPPKASDAVAQAAGFVGTRLGPSANEARPSARLPPDASGPQALAILNDGTLGSSQPYDCRTQEPARAMAESKMGGAVNCRSLHGPDPTDQPKELKGNSILHTKKKPQVQEKCAEKMTCPVEETVPQELANRTSKRDVQPLDHSKTKRAATGGDAQGFFDLYSASDLSCNITGCECPTAGSDYNRSPRGIQRSLVGARRYFTPVGGQPRSCSTTAPEAPYHDVIPAGVWFQAEGGPLHGSFADCDTCVAPLNETNPEGFVIVNKDD